MARSKNPTETPKFIVTNNNLQLKRDIINIAAHKGQTYSQLIRGLIIKFRDASPESERQPVKNY